METKIDESEHRLLSVIIPHYNTPLLLQKLLGSIPDIPQIEVLVIDDNSTSDLSIYKKCVDDNRERNVTFFSNTLEKKGAGNARNIGLTHAKGKWLLFADADDFFTESFWSAVSEHMEDTYDVIFFPPTSIQLDTNKESDRHTHYARLVKDFCDTHAHADEIKLRALFWSPCSKMIKNSLVQMNGIGFDTTLHSNDMMFSTKVGCCAKEIYAVDRTIYCITESGNSLTAHKDKKSMRIRSDVYCRYYFYLQKHLDKKDMKLLGFGAKDWLYFRLYRMKIIQLRDRLLKRN